MPEQKANRRFHTGSIMLVLVPFAALALGSCDPAEGGYPKVTDRDRGTPPAAAYPDPPSRVPPSVAGAEPVDLAAVDLPADITEGMVENGQQVYGRVCVACHGSAGTGSTLAPALNDEDWLHITGQYEEIVQITQSGVAQPLQYPGVMPPLGGANLDDDEIRAVSAYVFAISQAGGS